MTRIEVSPDRAWRKFPPESASPQLGWHQHRVPYEPQANDLQNLDIWIPLSRPSSSRTPGPAPSPPPLASLRGTWIIFIHGGAWRDPRVTCASFAATVTQLLLRANDDTTTGSASTRIGALASLNYSLAPHPEHPAGTPDDPSRNARHPQPIGDVLRGLAFLQQHAGFRDDYVLLGHSCGATLTFQALLNPQRWGLEAEVIKPRAVIGLNGLYDLPALIHDPGPQHEGLVPIYAEFITGAFGADEQVWGDASPTSVQDWARPWAPDRRRPVLAVLVQSRDDTLVPYRQTAGLLRRLQSSAGDCIDVRELPAAGDHNELWEKGDRLAEIISEVLDMA